METNAIREYLRLIMSAISDSVKGAQIEETEDGPILLCSIKSPFSETDEIGYRLEIIPMDDGLLTAEVMMILFIGIEKEKLAGLNELIGVMNRFLTLGSLRLLEDETVSVLFVQGSVLEENMPLSSVTGMIGSTVSIMENAAFNSGEYIKRYLDGEEPGKLIEEISKED